MRRRPRWEMRILVAMPVLFVLAVLATSVIGIELILDAVGPVELTAGQSIAIQKVRLTLVGLGSVLAAVLGLLVAAAIVQPLRRMVKRLHARLDPAALVPVRPAVSELSELSNAFNHMLLSFDKFVSDSHIVDGLPLGVLLVDQNGRVRRTNAEARRLLHSTADSLEGRLVGEIGSPALGTALAAAVRRGPESDTLERPGSVSIADAVAPGVHLTLQLSVFPAGPADEFILTLRDLGQLPKIRSEIRRVDELAAVGAHVASLGHEMSGSLMAVQTLLDLLGTRAEREADIRQKMQAEMERASRLMEEMRAFGQVSLRERMPCQLAELLDDTVTVCEGQFAGKRIAVRRRITPSLPIIMGDADRVRQALANVVTNAFEATSAGGMVTVAAEREGANVAVRVANTGSYIAPEDRKRIFDLFYTTKKRGTGFGLALARRTIIDHGGSIDVASSEESGTEFVIRLPLSKPEPA